MDGEQSPFEARREQQGKGENGCEVGKYNLSGTKEKVKGRMKMWQIKGRKNDARNNST